MERYDPNSNSWTMVQKLKMAVTSAAVVAYDRMLYVAGKFRLFLLNFEKIFSLKKRKLIVELY